MKDETIIKIVAIIGLIVLEGINLVTAKYDGAIIGAIAAIIGGIAGYEIGKWRAIGFAKEGHNN